MCKFFCRAWLGIFAASVMLAGCTTAPPSGGRPPAGPAEVTVAPPLVKSIVEWDPYIGRLEAVESVDVRARVSGYLQAHFFDEGQLVEKGEPLFLIDPRPFEAAMAEAEAALAEARSAVIEAKAVATQTAAERKQVTARLDLATSRLNRSLPLVPRGAVTEDEFDILESERDQAVADLEAADAAIASAEARTEAARAVVDSTEAKVRTARLNLSFTKITAPISGRISRRLATTGNLIAGGSAGATLLTTIVSVDPIHCYFDANERALLKYLRLARNGKRESSRDVKNPVYLALIDEQGFPHRGHMDFVDNRVDSQTGTIRGRAIFPNADKVLSPGMFADVRLPGSGRYEALLIPDGAISSDQAEQFVFVVDADNKASRRVVELGPQIYGLRVVRAGIEPGERIVTRGLQRVRDGAEVKPTEETITATAGEGLPDDYQPVPREEWLTPPPMASTATAAESAEAATP